MDDLPEFTARPSSDPHKNRELQRGFRRLYMRYPELCQRSYELCSRFETMNRDVPSMLTEPCREEMKTLCVAVSVFNGDETAIEATCKVLTPLLAFRPRWDRDQRKTVWERADHIVQPGAKLSW